MKIIKLESMSLEEFRHQMDDYYWRGRTIKQDLIFDIYDECEVETELYECSKEVFALRGLKKRNNDFYKSHKKESKKLERWLD